MGKDSAEFANDLINFIYESPTAYHAVSCTKATLDKNNFKELKANEKWNIKAGGKYYVTSGDTALIAFSTGMGDVTKGFRIIGAHNDSPTFKIKPAHEINYKDTYVKLNTEVYGGPILSTWFDRPLALAGKVSLKGSNAFKPKMEIININKPLMVIPNLAIHFNREVNDGYKYNAQKDTLPLLALINGEMEKENVLIKTIAKHMGVNFEDIVDFELFLYEYEKGKIIGLNEEFISSPRLDDLWMVYAGLNALVDSDESEHIKVLLTLDHEEVGSGSAQGANSAFILNTLKRIAENLGACDEDFHIALANSMAISSDLAHAVHPNYEDKHDPINRPVLGKGPVLKYSAKQKYITTVYSASVFAACCENAGVPYQKYANRSDILGGSTIAHFLAANLAIDVVDMGNPILGMHSVRELGAVCDNEYIYKAFKEFYSCKA
ncbi:M18 family aminopeptidase [Tyzzerella sp. OttesenSCG-928-J15]|nr:M18 family aminopeptidase [Tyzzerella sp. OttesenSCG-928-J15]